MLKDIIRYFFGGYQKRRLVEKRETLHQKRSARKYLEAKIGHVDKSLDELGEVSLRDMSDENLARIASLVYNNYPGQSKLFYNEFKKAKEDPKYLGGYKLKEELKFVIDSGKQSLEQKKEQYKKDIERLEKHRKVPMYLLERIAEEQTLNRNYLASLNYQRNIAGLVMGIGLITGFLSISPIVNGNVIGSTNRYSLIGITSILLFIVGLSYLFILNKKKRINLIKNI